MARQSIIETAIRTTATNKLNGKYNLAQYKEGAKRHGEKLAALQHKRICEEIINFKEQHDDVPFYLILSVGVAKGAYKKSEYDKGYKNFDADKVEAVVKFGQAYNEYNGLKTKKLSDVTIRLMMRYYEKVSQEYETFINDLNKSQKLGKVCAERGDYKTLCKNLNIPFNTKDVEEKETTNDIGTEAA